MNAKPVKRIATVEIEKTSPNGVVVSYQTTPNNHYLVREWIAKTTPRSPRATRQIEVVAMGPRSWDAPRKLYETTV